MSSIEINNLQRKDFTKILALLRDSNLPISDINFDKQEFLIVEINTEIVGSIALEKYGKNAILRSFAVKKAYRK
jgi:N-acetylglutamate synthase-like GNAT family acetyltransferase